MGILLKNIKNTKLKLLKFKNYPVLNLLDDDKIKYFKGLNMVKDIVENALEYYRILILSADLSENINFNKKNDISEKEFIKIVDIINKNDLSLNFIFDFTTIALKNDGKLKIENKNMIKTFLKFFKIGEVELKNIKKLSKAFIKNDRKLVFDIIEKNYKSEDKIFDYLIEYYKG